MSVRCPVESLVCFYPLPSDDVKRALNRAGMKKLQIIMTKCSLENGLSTFKGNPMNVKLKQEKVDEHTHTHAYICNLQLNKNIIKLLQQSRLKF